MKYYYFDPIRRQYYFPDGYENYSIFKSFYQPYTILGKILWFLWRNSSLIRWICVEKSIEKLLPVKTIIELLSEESILAFNQGTRGVEQKITILGIGKRSGKEFFIKYADRSIARKNVENEGKVLLQLKHLDFVPIIELFRITDNYTIIKTSVLNGNRVNYLAYQPQILDVLFLIANQKVVVERSYSSDFRTCFAHGDFCPWNMMVQNGQLKIYDWEMAGDYSLGYDLFTFIFQTSFLFKKLYSINDIVIKHFELISEYFTYFGISNWYKYLNEFAILKLQFETQKGNTSLILPYKKLREYVEKI